MTQKKTYHKPSCISREFDSSMPLAAGSGPSTIKGGTGSNPVEAEAKVNMVAPDDNSNTVTPVGTFTPWE